MKNRLRILRAERDTGLILAIMAVIFHAALDFRCIKDGAVAGEAA